MGVRYPGRAEIDPMAPQALGICDDCGFQYNLRALRSKMQWAGTRLINLGFLVCERCWDVPQDQLRSIRLPPDPEPVFNTRVENFAVDEQNAYLLTPPPGRSTIFDTVPAGFVTVFFGDPRHGGTEVIETLTGSATRPAVTLALITFTSSSAAQTNMTYVAVYDGATGGTLLAAAPIPLVGTLEGDIVQIAAGVLATAIV